MAAETPQREIPLEQGVMQEFTIDPSTPIPETVKRATGEGQSLEFFLKTYYNEVLIEGRFPLIDYGGFKGLEQISIDFRHVPYEIPDRFSLFAKKILQERKGDAWDGPIISTCDISITDVLTPRLVIRPASYFNLIQTNLAQDVDMSKYDDIFNSVTTWRSLEVKDGKTIPLSMSKMVNQLCLSYIILTEDEKHMISGMRRSNLAVEGGTTGLLGSTPRFSEDYLKGTERFGDCIGHHIQGQLARELCVEPEEYLLKEGFAMRDLMRGSNLFMVYMLRGVKPEVLAERCRVSKEAKKEHARLYVAPFTLEAIASLEKGSSGYSMNLGTLGGCYYALKAK